MEEVINGILIREVETKNIMTKSSLPVGGYSVNPLWAVHMPAGVLSMLLYEALLYWAQGGMGHFP